METKEYSPSITLNLRPKLNYRLREYAKEKNISLNQLLNIIVSSFVEAIEFEKNHK